MTPAQPDTLSQHLHALYRAPSKHHAYQSVPDFVSAALDYREPIDDRWRGDHCRLTYLLRVLPCDTLRTLTDIGANTGFFALSLAHRFPQLRVTACEPDQTHAQFIRTIADTFGLQNVDVRPSGVTLQSLSDMSAADAVLLLNVLHHAGYDFDTSVPRTRDGFEAHARAYLRGLAAVRTHLFFQMGSNWGGDTSNPLVARDAHVEKLRFMAGLLVGGGWQLRHVAYPTRVGGVITYRDLPGEIVDALNDDPRSVGETPTRDAIGAYDLDQFPGEFYKRPLFTCVSPRRA